MMPAGSRRSALQTARRSPISTTRHSILLTRQGVGAGSSSRKGKAGAGEAARPRGRKTLRNRGMAVLFRRSLRPLSVHRSFVQGCGWGSFGHSRLYSNPPHWNFLVNASPQARATQAMVLSSICTISKDFLEPAEVGSNDLPLRSNDRTRFVHHRRAGVEHHGGQRGRAAGHYHDQARPSRTDHSPRTRTCCNSTIRCQGSVNWVMTLPSRSPGLTMNR
jgi:hypothetical protein